jgi:hypothetical protein
MLRRFGSGLFKGLLVGGLLAAALVFGAGLAGVPAWAAYLLIVVTGALTGLIAGKPIWQKEARIEAGLKAGAGALLALGGLFAARQWLPLMPGLSAHGLAPLDVHQVSLAYFPVVSTVLALFFDLDNTPTPEAEAGAAPKAGEAAAAGRVRVSREIPELDELDDHADPNSTSQQAPRRNAKR